jgi:3-phosphoshikimate 1-carboxyvinyltransferase
MLRCPTPPAIELTPTGPLRATVRPPGSRSITRRALMCAALADGQSSLVGTADDHDTRVMVDSLRRLGISLEVSRGGTQLIVQGCGGRIPASFAELDFAGNDTTMRFLASMTAFAQETCHLDGLPRKPERRVEGLLGNLRNLGVDARFENNDGRPILIVEGHGLDGGTTRIKQGLPGQFLSGLLMVAPCARQNVTLRLVGRLTSQPRLIMTLAVMRAFNVDVPFGPDLTRINVDVSQSYRGRTYRIEPDAAAAGCFWAAAAITRGMITVEGLSVDSLQGHVAFCDCLQRMGCRVDYGANAITVVGRQLKGISVNMNAVGDAITTVAMVALFANSSTTITNVPQHPSDCRDRIDNLIRELRELGATIVESDDALQIIPGTVRGAEVDTHDDHRLAMSLALVGLRVPGVIIRDPQCTTKTYPTFFEELMALGD